MNTAVDQLLQADREAQQILQEAQQHRERMLSLLEDEKVALYRKYKERAQKHINDAHRADEAQADELIRDIRARHKRVLQALESHYAEHHAGWEDTLFTRVLEGAQ